jgi:ABC-type maltose transport system permease subunit
LHARQNGLQYVLQTTSDKKKKGALGRFFYNLQQFIGGQYSENWGPFAAGSIIASVPIVIIFLSLQKYIVNGLTAGSVKG